MRLIPSPRRAAGSIAAVLIGIFVSAATLADAADSTPAAAPQKSVDNEAGSGQGSGNGKGGGHGAGRGGGKGGGRGTGGGGGQPQPSASPAQKLETVKGEVTHVDGGEPAGADAKAAGTEKGAAGRPGPMITIRTEKETLQVHAGAPHYRHEQQLELRAGDVIEISGVRAASTPSMFTAYVITKGDKVVRLRDEQGTKLWKPRNRAATPELSQVKAKIVELEIPATHSPGSGLGRATKFIVVRTDDEELAVEAGPDDYLESKGLTLHVGDAVTITGWRLPSARTANKPIMLGASISKGKSTVKLRDDHRKPLWQAEKK